MENKLAITMVALMVVALAAPGVMGANENTYTANVVASAVTVAPTGGLNFGDLLVGATKEIPGSLTLTNTGGAAADVSAKFTTSVVADTAPYGLVSGSSVIDGTNFWIGTGTGVQLASTYDDTELESVNQVPANDGTNDGVVVYNAILNVPDTAEGSYSGNVLLTFTAVAP